jgi:hypothetical protein
MDSRLRGNDEGRSGNDRLCTVLLLSALSWALHMNKLTLAWRLTVSHATTANKSPCPLVRKGVKGDFGGAGDRSGIMRRGAGQSPVRKSSLVGVWGLGINWHYGNY